LVTTILNSTVNISRLVGKLITPIVISTITIPRFIKTTVTAFVTSIVSMVRARARILTFNVTMSLSFSKQVSKTFSLILTNIFTFIYNVIPLFGSVFRDTLYTPVRKRVIQVVQQRTLQANSIKDRLVYLVKIRLLTKRKDTDG